jgi:DNA-binding response OmpR family regulator
LPRILAIDDQPHIRTMVSMLLRVSRFEVVEAASAVAGLNEFEGSAFDIAIVDIFLHETNGLEVIRKMRESKPGFPIVAMSGMTTLDFVLESPELSNVICLQKPFRPAELARAIEAAVASHPPAAGEGSVAGSVAS